MLRDLIRSLLIAVLGIAALHTSIYPALVQAAVSPVQPLTVDSPMGALLDNAVARKIIEQHLPVLLSSAQIEQARGLSLRSLQQFAPSVIADSKLDAINAELARRKVVGTIQSTQSAEMAAAAARDAASREALTLVTIPLWDHGAPGAKGAQQSDIPALTVVRLDGATSFGTAMIVAPGGGYPGRAMGHEGRQVADLLAAQGITAFILRYRLCSYGYQHPTQLQDARCDGCAPTRRSTG
jgi:acetyl esterase/lipase